MVHVFFKCSLPVTSKYEKKKWESVIICMYIGEYTVILEAVYTCPLIQHIHVQESIGYTQYTNKWLLICMFKKCFNGKSFKQIYAN